MLVDLATFHQKSLQRKGIFFSYIGPFSQNLLVEMGDILKQKMKLRHASPQTILKVFSMVVEQTQNIIYYSTGDAESTGLPYHNSLNTGTLAVGFDKGQYFVLCGNLVSTSAVGRLDLILESLQDLSAEELKELYKTKRREGPDILSKGAGLGFIEMARKASKVIEHRFDEIDEQYTFFTISAQVQE